MSSDFYAMAREIGMGVETIRARSIDESDLVDMPDGVLSAAFVGNSNIEGRGVFSFKQLNIGDIIGPARIGLNRTIIGRYVNHAGAPNCDLVMDGGNLIIVSKTDIAAGDEITIDYRNVWELTKGDDYVGSISGGGSRRSEHVFR